MSGLGVIYLILMTVVSGVQSIVQKGYSNKFSGRGSLIFGAASAAAALLFFFVKALVGGNLEISPEIIPFAAIYGVGYYIASVCYLLAMASGPLALSSLVLSYSLIIPTGYGIIFDGDEVGVPFYIGAALLLISLFLFNSRREETKISGKWVFFSLLTFIGNGACSTAQTEAAERFLGRYDDIFMVLALAFATLTMTVLALVKERKEIKTLALRGTPYFALRGALNAVANLLLMLTVGLGVAKSLLFPLTAAAGIIITYVISIFIYKERLSAKQNVAIALGTLSIVFLSI